MNLLNKRVWEGDVEERGGKQGKRCAKKRLEIYVLRGGGWSGEAKN